MSVSTLLLSCIVATFWITLINGATLGVTITEVPETTVETATESLVTVAECKDKLDNCFNYGDEECVGRYAPWAHANCPYRCGYCPGNYPPCEDKITYCKELGNDACTQKIYQGFIRLNCRKTCNKCTIPALDYKPGTDNDTVVHPTDVVPSRPSEVNKPTLGQTNETASECDDKKDNCFNYDDSKCLGIYAPWAKDNCALRCGYCPGKKPPCVDNIAYCNEYSDDICTSSGYAGWARTNCRKYCNLCEVPYHGNDTINETSQTTKTFATATSPGTAHVTPSTEHITPPHGNTGEPVRQTTTLFPVLPTGVACQDVRNDCDNYDEEACNGVFKVWAMTNCARRCGYCTNEGTPCMDYENCGHLPHTLCTAVEYRDIAITSCRKFCGLCSDSTPSPSQSTKLMETTMSPVTTSSMQSTKNPSVETTKTPSESTVILTQPGTIQTTTQPMVSSVVLTTLQPEISSTNRVESQTTSTTTLKHVISTGEPSTSRLSSSPILQSSSTVMPTPPKPVKSTMNVIQTNGPNSNQSSSTTNPDTTTTQSAPSKLIASIIQPDTTIVQATQPSSTSIEASVQQTTSAANRTATSTPAPASTLMSETSTILSTSKQQEISTQKITNIQTPPKPLTTTMTPSTQTPSPVTPDVSKGQPTPAPTFPTFSISSNGPKVCNKTFAEPLPKCCNVCSCPGEEVFGRVLNQVGEPLEKAEVSFSGCDCVRYLTDSSGNYAIQDICVDGHEMFYQAAGYLASKVLPVPVVKGGKFWKADNILTLKPNVPGLNVTDAPTGR